MRKLLLPLCCSGLIFFLSCQSVEPPVIPITNINQFVTEPLTTDSPFYACGEQLWTHHAWQWGAGETVFRQARKLEAPLPLRISVNGLSCPVKGGNCFAAYQEAESEPAARRCNMAMNVFRQGYPKPLVDKFDESAWYPVNGTPTSRQIWRGKTDAQGCVWYGVDFGQARQIQHLVIELAAPDSLTPITLPRHMRVEYFSTGGWRPVASLCSQPALPTAGRNLLSFSAIIAEKIRVVFQGALNSRIGLIGFQVSGETTPLPVIREQKFITADDVLVSLLTLTNPSWHDSMQINVQSYLEWADDFQQGVHLGQMSGQLPLWLAAASDMPDDVQTNPAEIYHMIELAPRAEFELRFVLAVSGEKELSMARARDWLRKIRPLDKQKTAFLSRIEATFPGFYCSERWLNQLYYQRVLMMLRELAANTVAEDSSDFQWMKLSPAAREKTDAGFADTMRPPDIDSAGVAGYLNQQKNELGSIPAETVQQLWTAFYSHFQSPKSRLDIRMLGEQPHQFEAAPLPPNSLGLLDFTLGVLWGLKTIPENGVQITPAFPADTVRYWAVTDVGCGPFSCDLVWDKPDSVDYLDDQEDGLQLYVNQKYVCSTPRLEPLTWRPFAGKHDK